MYYRRGYLYSVSSCVHLFQVSEEEVSKLLVTGIEPVMEIHPCYAEFTYTPRSLPDDTTPLVRERGGCGLRITSTNKSKRKCTEMSPCCVFLQCILSMFEDMGFINTYKIDLQTLARLDSIWLFSLMSLF